MLDAVTDYQVPLRLIDGVIEQSDEEIIAVKQVSAGEAYFQGHFPENPVMPGILTVQAIVEAIEVLNKNHTIKLSKIRKVKFRQMIKPGDSLNIRVNIKDPKKLIFIGSAFLDEKIACSAELEFSLD